MVSASAAQPFPDRLTLQRAASSWASGNVARAAGQTPIQTQRPKTRPGGWPERPEPGAARAQVQFDSLGWGPAAGIRRRPTAGPRPLTSYGA